MSRIPTITTNITAASVNGSDAGTHERLDIINDTITNKHLDRATDSVDISGQVIQINGLNGLAKESTLSNINENIPTMLSDNGNRLLVNTEGQSVGITNFPENQTVNVVSGSINVNNFPSNQQVFGSVNVSNMINGYATETTSNAIKSAIDNKRLSSLNDSVSVSGSSVSISNPVAVSNHFTLDATSQTANSKLDTLNNTLINKRLSSATDSVSVNTIFGFNLEGTQQEVSGKLTALKTAVEQKRLNIATDSVTVNTISNYATDLLQNTTNSKLDTISSNIVNKRLDKLQDSVDISGQTVNVNTISGFTLDTTTQATNDDLEKIINKKGDIESTINYDAGASVWADTVPIPIPYNQDPNGWRYRNTNTGNAMNLFYFNGANEIKTLSQVTGQYAVVTNISTKQNDKMIFSIYTKSASSFFTTRITHTRPNSSFSMVAGGKYLLYWGNVSDDIYPNLPRINFTSVVTTGPAIPTEEILSVALNTDSGATAGDLDIFIESLGVVFVNQSRVYSLYGYTEYETIRNINNNLSVIRNNTDDIKYKTDYLTYYNEVGVNELMTYDRASETNLIDIKNNTNKLKFSGEDLKAVISNSGFNCTNIADTPLITGFATQSTLDEIKSNSDKLKYTGDDLKTVISNTGFNCTNIANTPLITGFATQSTLDEIKSNSDKFKYTGDDLKTVISNTGFNCSNIANTPLITGFSTSTLQTAGNTSLSDIKANSDKLKYVGDDLKAVISNTGFDAKVRDKDNNAITSTVFGIDGVRGLDVSIKNATQADPLVVEIPATNIINTFSTNLPASYPIDAGGALSSATGALNVNLRDTQGNTFGVAGAPLVVESNLITGFALENGNLASIKSNSDKFKFNDDNLKCEVINSGTNNLGVTVSNNISGFAPETGGNLASIKANSDKNNYDASGNLLVNVAVGGGSSGGTVNIKDTNGANILSDGSGNLKVNIANSSVPVSIASTVPVSIASTVAVSGNFYPSTQSVSGSVQISNGVNNAGLSLINNDIASDRGLITASCLYARAPAFSGIPSTPLTCFTNGSRAYLETRDEDAVAKLTTIDTGVATTNSRLSTTNTTLSAISSKMVTQANAGNTVGLNVYNIYPNKLIYRMAGSASAPVASQFLGPEALAYNGSTFNIGLNYPRSFNIYLTSAGTRSVDIDYIDANGNRALTTITINNTDTPRLTNAVNINNMSWTPSGLNADTTLRAIARTDVYRNQLPTFLSGAGVITVPNGYVGIVSNLYYNCANGDDLIMVVRDKYNNIKTTRYMAGIVPAAYRYTNVGDINEPLYAGDSVYFLSGLSGAGQRYLHAIVTLEAI